jgi:hypothetical protein
MGIDVEKPDAAAAANSTENVSFADVIGNKEDEVQAPIVSGQTSIAGYLHTIHEHIHGVAKIYPVLANPVQLQKASGVWAAFPTPTEIIPAGTIGDAFDIHFCIVSNISANSNCVLRLYKGAALSEVEIATIAFVRNAILSQEGSIPLMTELLAANTRISGALSGDASATITCDVKLFYHIY